MGESKPGSENGQEPPAAEAKADDARDEAQDPPPRAEDGVEGSSRRSHDGSSASSGAAEDSELALLQGGGSPRAALGPVGQRSNYFRQRSMHSSALGHDEGGASGRRIVPFDVENGLHTSDSRAKLESLEQSSQSPISAAVVLKTLFFVLVWYTFSTCLTLYNKTLLGDKLGKFPAPLLMNTVHFTLQAVLSKVIMCFQSKGSDNGVPMTWRDYFIRVVPTAFGTALDINLSNASLVFISVTFATMCKSASPIFLLLFAFAFRLESPSIKLVGIILVISIGVLLTVAKETEFEFWGFVFVMLAAVMSGFRWLMTQILLQKEVYGLHNPITLMSYVAPVMAVATAILSFVMDPWHDFETNVYFDNTWHIIRSCMLMLIGGSLAFFMVLTEYILVSATSAVTVTIAGVVKEAVTILVAVFYFHDQFSSLKGIGLFTIMVGVSLFNWYKYQKLKNGQPSENEETMPSISTGDAKYVIVDDSDFLDDNS